MTTQTLINRAEKRDAPAERGGRNRPVAAGGASSGTARKEHCCPGTEDLMEEWVDWKRTKIGEKIRDYTFKDLYLYNVNKYIMPVFHAMPIKEIDFETIDIFIGNLKREDGKPMAGSTKHNIMVPFRGIIEHALKKEYIEKNPLDLVNPIKVNHKSLNH